MRSGLFLLTLVVASGAIGYVEIRHRAEREQWRAEVSRLGGRLERAKSQLEELDDVERGRQAIVPAAARLAELETQILNSAAELARLESDRSVARVRTAKAIDDLKRQVRALTEIEIDLTALDRRRQRLESQVKTVEDRLEETETAAAKRQKRAEALDRDIAGLAVRRESLLSNLEVAERTMAATALALEVEKPKAVADASISKNHTAEPATLPAAAPAAITEDRPLSNGKRARGLYRFGSLSAAPEAEAAGQGGRAPSTGNVDAGIDGTDWAEKQYLAGLTLLSSAEQRSGTRELSDAVLAFKAVLGEWPREKNPVRWAIARSDLGYALALLGKRQGNAGILENAATACREALDEFGREETPLLWAAAQHHLGVSLNGLADIRDDRQLRQQSIEALETAIAAFKGAGAETDARKVESRLREAYDSQPAPLPKTVE